MGKVLLFCFVLLLFLLSSMKNVEDAISVL